MSSLIQLKVACRLPSAASLRQPRRSRATRSRVARAVSSAGSYPSAGGARPSHCAAARPSKLPLDASSPLAAIADLARAGSLSLEWDPQPGLGGAVLLAGAAMLAVPRAALAEGEADVPYTDYAIGFLFGVAILGLLVLTIGTAYLSLKDRADREEERKAEEKAKLDALRLKDPPPSGSRQKAPRPKRISLTTGAPGFGKKDEE